MNNMKKKEIMLALLVLIYIICGCSYVFLANGWLNKIISIQLGFAQFYAFMTFFAILVLIISIIFIILGVVKNKLTVNLMNIMWIITIIFSLLFINFDNVSQVSNNQLIARDKIIKLVEFNVANNLNENNIRAIFKEFDADIAVFPELGGYEKGDRSNKRLIDLFSRAGLDFQNYHAYESEPTSGNIAPVTVVIKKSFGNYNLIENKAMTVFGTVYLSSASNDIPNIVGLHTAPPLPSLMELWRRDLNLIVEIANKNPDSFIIGDFNATMKHGSLSEINTHQDVLEYASKFNSGTWNRNMFSLFRPRIDHILIPKDQYIVHSVEIKNYDNSDHLCVFVQLQRYK